MKKFFKSLKFILLIFLMFYAAESSSAPDLDLDVNFVIESDPRDVVDDATELLNAPHLEVHDTTYFKLCKIRRMFCGKTKVVMVAIAVFIVGVLIIAGKITWMRVMIIITGIVIFSAAELVTLKLTSFPPSLGLVYACYCNPLQIDAAFNEFVRALTFGAVDPNFDWSFFE
jgi:type IV secretory pathway VirB2 component (pilin)